ncbi:MAG: capping complex subunit for YIEGIA [Desulfocucumaceae bacterium]
MTNTKYIQILAVVTMSTDKVTGGAPIFIGRNEQECEKIARSLSRILDAMAHYLENDTYIIVSH